MLIVDNSIISREMVKLTFREEFNILETDSGKKALDIISGGGIDIVMLDLIMPGIDGLEVLRRRRDMPEFRNVPVVITSVSDSVENQVKAFELGASDFISKPFIPEVMHSRINNVMRSQARLHEVKSEAEQLKQRVEADEMTGLYNKAATHTLIDRVLSSPAESKNAMLMIDVDNFKHINDTAGHLTGDSTLRLVAQTIAGLFRKTDIIGRVGGDEFVVLMTDIPSSAIVKAKANELLELIKRKTGDGGDGISLSIGYVESTPETKSYTELFSRADAALYRAKALGKARVCEYNDSIKLPPLRKTHG